MASKKMAEALNSQLNAELFSAYLYLSMSANATHLGLEGTANWFFVQTQEEMIHAQRFYNFINSIGEKVVLDAIEKPASDFDSPLGMFESGLKHEKLITKRINDLVDLAIEERDHATEVFLQWFVTEQVEEEENANDIIAKLKLAGNQGGGLFMVDKELGTRIFTPPVNM